MSADYKDTLNLPQTDFPMKADLPKREPQFIEFWDRIGLYEKLMERRNSCASTFILHDGPPYANGDIHVGHALNKVLKDVVCRYHWLNGEYAPFVPGWDCHGQPIEHQVEKQLGSRKDELSKAEFRELCRKYAETYIERQREQFRRLGVIGTWDKPYLTLDRTYEASDVRTFASLYKNGLVYRGLKPIYWCYTDRTALAEAEIEYADKTSHSIKVKFLLLDELPGVEPPVYAVIWTTTPWTLPANVALAFSPEATYVVYDTGSERLVFAEALAESNARDGYREVARFPGSQFENTRYRHAIYEDRESVGILADFVGLDTGTGIVHIAPGHGEEDFLVGQRYGLPIVMPVGDDGRFTESAGWLAGLSVTEANEHIISFLEEAGTLYERATVTHSYPHCWRCKQPVIFRATEQWFIRVADDGLRRDALEAVKKVSWVPSWSVNRIESMLEERPDWCISRQRSWGIPIPIVYCETCGAVQGEDSVFETIATIFEREGADSWFTRPAADFVPAGYTCEACGGSSFRKEEDIFDVWFESGNSHFAVLESRDELRWPADMYLEGSDQHRGWFQSSLLVSVGVSGVPPYRSVLTHGFVVDEEGRKMSKSLGNVVDPLEVMDRLGADVLRLWAIAADYSSDVAISDQILNRMADAYRRIRNTFRFMLGNLFDFDPARDRVQLERLEAIDRFIWFTYRKLEKDVLSAYEQHRYHAIFHGVHNFCAADLSAFYLDVLKDRLYAERADDSRRRSTQTVLYDMARGLALLLAPIIPFTTEEVWQHLPRLENDPESVHLATFPDRKGEAIDEELVQDWNGLLELRKHVLKAYEGAKERGIVKTMLEARVHVFPGSEYGNVARRWESELPLIMNTRQVILVPDQDNEAFTEGEESLVYNFGSVKIAISHAQGTKCARCWNWTSDVDPQTLLCERCARVLSE